MTTPRGWRRSLLGLAGVALFLACWQAAVEVGVVDERDVASASAVLSEVVRQAQTHEFWRLVGETIGAALLGLGSAAAIAVPAGLVMGANPLVLRAFRPTVEFLRPVPGVALIPLAILLWGKSTTTVVSLVTFGCFWPLLIQAVYGVQALDEVALRTASSFGLTRAQRIRWLIVPGSLPYLATGLRIAASIALIVAVSVELLAGAPGLGSAILVAQGSGAFTEMYALVLTAGVLGVLLYLVFVRLEAHFLHWHLAQQDGGGSR